MMTIVPSWPAITFIVIYTIALALYIHESHNSFLEFVIRVSLLAGAVYVLYCGNFWAPIGFGI